MEETEAEKQHLKSQLAATADLLATHQSDSGQISKENETQVTEMLERIRGKELVIDQNVNEMRQLKSTLKSQETSIAYFKRQIQELEEQMEAEKREKQELKLELGLAKQES